jgi:hypothetical protein
MGVGRDTLASGKNSVRVTTLRVRFSRLHHGLRQILVCNAVFLRGQPCPLPYLIAVLPQVAVRRETAMWRVFWVPQDAVRAGVRRRVLAGWDDLPGREDAAGVQAGDPIFLSPDYRVDPLLGLYVQSATFRKYTAETRRNYATDIALLLTFLWGRGRAWTDAAERDLEDYEHWRRFVFSAIQGAFSILVMLRGAAVRGWPWRADRRAGGGTSRSARSPASPPLS